MGLGWAGLGEVGLDWLGEVGLPAVAYWRRTSCRYAGATCISCSCALPPPAYYDAVGEGDEEEGGTAAIRTSNR